MIFAFIKLFNLKPCNWKPKSRSALRVRLEWDLLEPQGINPCCPSDVSLLEWWYPPLTFSSIYIQQSYINVNRTFRLNWKLSFYCWTKWLGLQNSVQHSAQPVTWMRQKLSIFFNKCFRERTNIIVHRESCKWRKAGYWKLLESPTPWCLLQICDHGRGGDDDIITCH